ncbi:polysaccharide deacetylase [Microvirga vignae]|uniref:Chitooligosaccharide deacetylase n=1 Tax=Microvirga vignae TaxID=1225564 RepID=A0A0H1R628_9HYPH|nr:polysaccharide deacetylase [Microvirga vignae]
MRLPHHNRYPFSPIHKRPVYEWPNGTRLAVTFCNNIEVFAYRAGLGSDSAAGTAPQNQRNFAWREYGNRVGLWSYLDLLDDYGVPGSHNVNSLALELSPDIVERINARAGDEYIAHGRTNAERQDVLWEVDEERMIAECTQSITRITGRKPEGWMGPYLAQSDRTLDLLKEAGYSYQLDWPADDQPFWMKTRSGPILSVPYPLEINDSPALVFRQHSGREFSDMAIDQFDEMLERSKRYPLVFGISVHPFIIGQPFRMRAFRWAMDHILKHRDQIWITTPGEIAKFAAQLPSNVLPRPD